MWKRVCSQELKFRTLKMKNVSIIINKSLSYSQTKENWASRPLRPAERASGTVSLWVLLTDMQCLDVYTVGPGCRDSSPTVILTRKLPGSSVPRFAHSQNGVTAVPTPHKGVMKVKWVHTHKPLQSSAWQAARSSLVHVSKHPPRLSLILTLLGTLSSLISDHSGSNNPPPIPSFSILTA